MGENGIGRLFSYQPDAAALKARMLREARELYHKGLSMRLQPQLESYEGILEKFYLYPTFRCPLKCPYCYAEGGERHVPELPPEIFLRMTQEAVDAGYKSVVIVGGEPLVYPGFGRYLDGLEKIRKNGCSYILRTSFAFSVQDRLLKKLASVFDEIVVSIDGDEETHDAVRGRGTFSHAVSNVEKVLAMGGHISVSAVLSAEQAAGRPGQFLRTFCREHGILKLVMNSAVPMGRAEGNRMPYFEWRSDRKMSDRISPSFSCGLGRSLYVRPDGSVFPCYAWCEKEHQLGDLSRESLKDILERKELLSIINSGVDTNEKCRSCNVRYFCGGKCKIWVNNKKDINSGDFDCTEKKRSILKALERSGVLSEGEAGDSNVLQNPS